MTDFEHLQGTEFEEWANGLKAELIMCENYGISPPSRIAQEQGILTALNDTLGREKKLRTALEWYLADDKRSVEGGILEKVEHRPAWGVLNELGDDR